MKVELYTHGYNQVPRPMILLKLPVRLDLKMLYLREMHFSNHLREMCFSNYNGLE